MFKRTFVSFRERQLYALKRRTEMISPSLDQINILPTRPIDPENRPSWRNPLLKGKEALNRWRYFNISPQISDFKRCWKETFGQDLDEKSLLEAMFDKYQSYSNALATGNLDTLFPLVTVNLYAVAKKAIEQRPQFVETEYPVQLHWCIHRIHSMHQISNAVATTFGTSLRGLVAGISISFDTEQEIYAVVGDAKRERVSLQPPTRIREHIVFVRDLDGKFHDWKIAGISQPITDYYTNEAAFSAAMRQEQQLS